MHATSRAALAALCLAALSAAAPTRADIYRCVRDGGHVSYQQIPCSHDSEPLRLPEQRIGGSALRPGERALLREYLDAGDAKRGRQADVRRADDARARRCWTRRRQLQDVRARLRSGYRGGERDALHRRRDAYTDYLRRFCS